MNCSGHPKIWQTQKNSLIWKWYTFPLFPPTQSVLFSDEWLNPQSIGCTHPDFFLVTGAGNWQLLGASPEVPNLGRSVASANLLISPGTNWERVGQASKMGDLSKKMVVNPRKKGVWSKRPNQFTNRNGHFTPEENRNWYVTLPWKLVGWTSKKFVLNQWQLMIEPANMYIMVAIYSFFHLWCKMVHATGNWM